MNARTESGRLDYIDALRGWAILGVLLVHSTAAYIPKLPEHIGNLVSNGARGVQLFYLASAMTLFYSFSRKHAGERSYFNFFVRRAFRIAPAYYFTLFCVIYLGHTHVSVWDWISHFFFFNSINPSWINSIISVEWSVAIEVMFYLAVPLLFKKIRSLDSAVRFCMVSAVFAVIANAVFGWLLRSHPSLSNYGWDNYRLYCGRWTGEHELIG